MIDEPCRLMSGSATPRASTRFLMISMAWSSTLAGTLVLGWSTTDAPPCRSSPSWGLLPDATVAARAPKATTSTSTTDATDAPKPCEMACIFSSCSRESAGISSVLELDEQGGWRGAKADADAPAGERWDRGGDRSAAAGGGDEEQRDADQGGGEEHDQPGD